MVLLGLVVLFATAVVYGGVRGMVAIERRQVDVGPSVLREWVEQEEGVAADRAAGPAAALAGRWPRVRRVVRLVR